MALPVTLQWAHLPTLTHRITEVSNWGAHPAGISILSLLPLKAKLRRLWSHSEGKNDTQTWMMAHHKILNKRGAGRKYGDAYIIWSLIRARYFTLFPLQSFSPLLCVPSLLLFLSTVVWESLNSKRSTLHLILAKRWKKNMKKKTTIICFVIMYCLEAGLSEENSGKKLWYMYFFFLLLYIYFFVIE